MSGIPVMHRNTVLGHASTQAGALRVAKKLSKLQSERHTARLVRVLALEPEDIYEGPAWAVGVALR